MSINPSTTRIVHDFVREAFTCLADSPEGTTWELEDELQWERGSDGHFRGRKKHVPSLGWKFNDEWLSSCAGYQHCIESMKADPVVGPHLEGLVGTWRSASRITANSILRWLTYSMFNEQGILSFDGDRFHAEWQQLGDFFETDRIISKMVSPLPGLVVPAFPLHLNCELVLDRLTDKEVTRGNQVGLLRPIFQRISFIDDGVAVGIRRTISSPKIVQRDNQINTTVSTEEIGQFGRRSEFRDDLVVEDVLSTLRLFKPTKIKTLGSVSWVDAPWLGAGISFQLLGQWPNGGSFHLSEPEIAPFIVLWKLLEKESARFEFSIRRFNLAFDRRLLDDRLVDLIMAAEALFLGDTDEKDRGELRFRFALRAAKFIEHQKYDELAVYRLMRRAYDARSAIVHGGTPKDTRLPDDKLATLDTFIDAIEEIVRLGLRKGLSMEDGGKRLRQSAFWDSLILKTSMPLKDGN